MACALQMVAGRLSDAGDASAEGQIRLVPEGQRLHYGEAIALCEAIEAHVSAGRRRFALDGSGLIDVTLPAIALLVEQIRAVHAAGGRFTVMGLTGRPLSVFEIYHLDMLIEPRP